MSSRRWVVFVGTLVLGLGVTSVFAGAATKQDFSDLQKEVENLRQRLAARNAPAAPTGPIGRADAMVEGKYGPNAPVVTKAGKLQIGGLLQVWSYSIQNDHFDYNAHKWSSNEMSDNNGTRIRRAELKFSMDITDDITAVVMLDPTGGDEANTFPGIPSNQSVVGKSWLSGNAFITLADMNNQPAPGTNGRVAYILRRNMQNGYNLPNRVLQDAYINYHSPCIPHHDFTVGQFKPPLGEEGNRNSGQLDFAERAMINQFSDQRDLGIMAHGWWWDERFQYWIGGFDAAGSFQNTFASFQNRSDDNDAKDLAWKVLLRPVWKEENWGSLEFGYSRQDGLHGESGTGYAIPFFFAPTVDGLSLQKTKASRQYAWLSYRPGGPVKGWWMRGEWGDMHDRALPGWGGTQFFQIAPRSFKRDGWYAATGYKLSESIFSDDLKNNSFFLWKMLNDVEFAYRYEKFGNLIVEDATGNHQDTAVFPTRVHTFGINYYWKGYNVRTQLNYMIVDEDEGSHGHNVNPAYPPASANGKRIREVKNNVFLISQQVQW